MPTLAEGWRRWRGFGGRRGQIALLSALLFVAVAGLAQLPFWPLVDYRAFDYLSTIGAPPLPEDAPIVVAIDEPSLADINQRWPWPRSLHGRLIAALRAAGAKAIGFDIVFSEPSTEYEDAAFEEALGPDVVLAADESLVTADQADQLIRAMPLQRFSEKGARAGIASVALGRDGVLREAPSYPDGFAATLAKAAGDAFDTPDAGRLIQVFGGPRRYQTISYYQALDPDHFLPPGLLRGRVVLVGLSLQNAPTLEAGGADAFATPHTVHDGRLTAGVEIQATIFDNLRHSLSIRDGSDRMRLGLLLFVAVASALIVSTNSGWQGFGVGLALMAAVFVSCWFMLRYGRLFISPMPSLAVFVAIQAGQAMIDYAQERKSRQRITKAFAQYLAPELVHQLARDPSRLRLGGEKRELSILFCDVRGFTTIAEQLKDDPEQLTTLINRLLTPLSDIVLARGGTIDKYIGDCLMAFWNAPLESSDHAFLSVSAALDMLEAMDALNRTLEADAKAQGRRHFPLRIGVGVNTGDCVVGNMGSTARFDYSVLGDAVNLASRLEGASKLYDVPLLIGVETARIIGDRLAVFELDRIVVKGKTEEAPVFTVLRAASAAVLARHRELLDAHYGGDAERARDLAVRLAEDNPALSGYYARFDVIAADDDAL